MCCRFYMEMSPKQRSALYRKNIARIAKPLTAEGEVFPDMLVPVLASNKAGEKAVFPMIWGYHFDGIKRPIANARSETASEKPSFKEGWASHRCIIPASWYYEWEHTKLPSGKTKTGDKYAIQPKGEQTAWLCGLYRMENGFPVFAVVTREPTPYLRNIHDRMPLIMPKSRIHEWVSPEIRPEELLQYAVTDLIAEKAV